MVINATFNNISGISWWSVLLVEKTGENHRLVASHWQSFITYCCIEYTSAWTRFKHTTLVVIGTDYTGSCMITYMWTFRREQNSPAFEGPFRPSRQLSKSSGREKNQVQTNFDLHFAINISGNSPFGTPALKKNAERYEW